MSCYLAQFLDEWSYYFVLVFNLHWSCCTISSNKGFRSLIPYTPSFSMRTGRLLTIPALNLSFYTAMFSRSESTSQLYRGLSTRLCLRYCRSGSVLCPSGRANRTITSLLLLSTLPKIKYYKIKIYQLTYLKERILYIFFGVMQGSRIIFGKMDLYWKYRMVLIEKKRKKEKKT